MTFEAKKDPSVSVPCEANPDAESERRQITEYMIERFAKPVPLFSMVYTNILIDYSRILRSSWISACC